jgi:hypothetical protein
MEAITCFERAETTWKGSSMNLQNANKTCTQTIMAIDSHPMAASTATIMKKFWSAFAMFKQYTDNLSIELRLVRAWTMEITFKIHDWLSSISYDAVHEKINRNNWARKLADVIQEEITNQPRVANEIILRSEDFLPKLRQNNFCAKLPRFTFDPEVNKKRAITLTSLAIRQWLGFPNDKIDLLRAALIDILMGRRYDAILYLDEVWHMFMYPYATIMQGARPNQRNNPIFLEQILDTFKESWLSHPIFHRQTKIHIEFQYLQHQIDDWKKNGGHVRDEFTQ